jgi:hypothetical protein
MNSVKHAVHWQRAIAVFGAQTELIHAVTKTVPDLRLLFLACLSTVNAAAPPPVESSRRRPIPDDDAVNDDELRPINDPRRTCSCSSTTTGVG